METNQEKIDVNNEFEVLRDTLLSRLNAHHERMTASVHVWRKETTVCLECMEPTSEEMQSEAERQEFPKEHASVKPIGGLRKRHRGRHVAGGRRSQPEERTRGNCGSRKELAADCRRMTRHA
jgi:hypothetical protein